MFGGVEMKLIAFPGLILALVLVSGCDSPVKSSDKELVEMGSADSCDAAEQSCLLTHDGAELRLELARDIRSLQPFQLQLHTTGIQQPIESVNVEFFMEGMDMGLNRYRLLPVEGSWRGEITLAMCVNGRSDWRAVVEVNTQQQRYSGTFRFHSSK